MSEQILILGAGKSATFLINYLIQVSAAYSWHMIVADHDLTLAQSKTGTSPFAEARSIEVQALTGIESLIRQAQLVIALLPPPLLPSIAAVCMQARKPLITASYIDKDFKAMERNINQSGVFILCEMGLDPGIDHMSALKWIHEIRSQGGRILSFKSHCGGLVSPQSDRNPWHYKVSWNARNIVLAGSAGGMYKENGKIKQLRYHVLFENCEEISIPGLGTLAAYPNRDSLSYQTAYGLEDAQTFQRTTLRYPVFCKAWDAVVKAGLTRTDDLIGHPTTFQEWSLPILPFIVEENKQQLQYLGLFDAGPIPDRLNSSADVTQYLVEKKLSLQEDDRDMIVMLHQIIYELNGKKYQLDSQLIVHGKNKLETAMAKTVGFPLGIAAKLILLDKIKLRGLHIPIHKEIYEPVLAELAEHGIKFQDSIRELL
ncbi:MAG: saccharopine dehydrogenase NADP-binding domain-containing protein [Williamsia sp.]|nr:saccharopine dehydrogenase NADP-binding domain-containing protein [Williamsia sp.]